MKNKLDNQFPIRELSELTQVNTVTIRAWERRYGLLKPQRTEKGHRLYSQEDVRCVKEILAYMAKGVPVSKVKALLNQNNDQSINDTTNDWAVLRKQLEEVLATHSFSKINTFIRTTFLTYPVNLCRKEIIDPVIIKLESQKNSLADIALLQSSIIEYSLIRLNSKAAKKSLHEVILICAENSPLWKLALNAIELKDANYCVTLINQPCNLNTWLSLVEQYTAVNCILYQEGFWKEEYIQKIKNVLQQNDHLLLCGTDDNREAVC